MTPEEKDGYKGRIDQAQTKEDVDAIVLEAQKENAKKKVDDMTNLTDQEKKDAKDAIDNATNKGEVDKAVEDAQNKQDERQSLDAYKDNAKRKIDALDKLTPEEKDGYKGRVDQAQTKEEVDAIVLEALKENAKRKVADLNNLTEAEKENADQAIDNANNEREVNDAIADAERRNDDHRRDYEDYRYNRPLPFGPFYFGYNSQKPEEPKTQAKPELKVRKAYIKGYPDGTFRTEGKITRAEAASMIANLAGLDVSNTSNPGFKDTTDGWYNAAINAMIKKNLMEGDGNGNFRPNEPITRGEFARALFYIDKANSSKTTLKDIEGHKYQEAIERAYANGHINGYPDGTFRPDAPITRAEAVKILNHFDGRKVNENTFAIVSSDLRKFKDLNESHWAYYEILAACNTYSSSILPNGFEVISKIY